MTPSREEFASLFMLPCFRLERMLGVVRRVALPVEARAAGEAMLGREAVSKRLAVILTAVGCSWPKEADGAGRLARLKDRLAG